MSDISFTLRSGGGGVVTLARGPKGITIFLGELAGIWFLHATKADALSHRLSI